MPRYKRLRKPLTLTSFRQLRALAHPLRYRAFEALVDSARTGKQLAELLGKQPTHLYHHLGVLERAGLVRCVARRRKRGTTEKYFQAVSDRIAIDRRLFRETAVAGHAFVGQLLRITFEELAETLGDRASGEAVIKRLRIHTAPRKIASLRRRLEAWLRDFQNASDPHADAEYAVTIALYPMQDPTRR
jgi:DNA-binding transcriptional ArsR family regulator